jgi:hypothetical protein
VGEFVANKSCPGTRRSGTNNENVPPINLVRYKQQVKKDNLVKCRQSRLKYCAKDTQILRKEHKEKNILYSCTFSFSLINFNRS